MADRLAGKVGKVAVITGGASGMGLASDESSFVTGQSIVVDGGMSIEAGRAQRRAQRLTAAAQ